MHLDAHDLLDSFNEKCNRLWNEMMETTPLTDERRIALRRYQSENRRRGEVYAQIRRLKRNPESI